MKNFLQLLLFALFTCFSFQLSAQCFSEQTFITPGQSTFTVPGTSGQSYLIEIEAKGADGGDFLWGANPQTDGGEGATMKASFTISGGSDLLVVVGSSGFDAPGSPGGGGGGGGTAVILDNSDVLIAAGAGGGGGQGGANTGQGGQANTNSPPVGGAGLGSSGGGGFNAPGGDGPVSTGGGAGTLSGQGTGGNGGVTAGSGGAGFGGGGGGSGTVGGGGGGYKGGDGSDGSTDLNGKGGDSYINTLFSGTVIFNTPGTNGGGVNNNGSVTITCIPQSNVEISLVSTANLECFGGFGGSIEVTAMGGLEPYQYSLNGGIFGDSPIFSALSAGDYTVTVQDGGGTTDMLMVTLTSPPAIIGEIINVTNNVCFGASEGSIEVVASGGTSASGAYGYSINGSSVQNSGLFINLPNGFYVISFFDDNFCTTQVTTSITSPDDLDLIIISKTDVTCFGFNDGSCSVEAFGGTGGYMYSIDDGPFGNESIFFDLSAGTHIVTVMDEEECTEEVIVFLNEPDAISFDLSASSLTCFGDEEGVIEVVNVMGTSPFEFKINDGQAMSDSVFTGLPAGEYVVTVIDSAGCELMQSIELIAPDSLILTVTIVMEVQCGGDSTGAVLLELQNGVGQITYSVDQSVNFTGFFTNLPAGEFTASATDSLGCTTGVFFEIQESATFTLNIDTTTSVSCNGDSDGSFTVGVTDGVEPIQYSIDGGDFQDSPTFEGLIAGDYTVEVVDSTGCVNSIEVTIEEPIQLQFSYLDIQNIPCDGEFGIIQFSVTGGTPGYEYLNSDFFEPFNVDDTISFYFLVPSEGFIVVYDSNSCTLLDTIFVDQNDSLQLFISELVADNCGEDNTGSVDLNAVGGYAPLIITLNGESNEDGMFDSLAVGEYTATVEDDFGCTTSLDFNIQEIEGLILDSLSIGNVSCNGAGDGFVEFFISNGNGMISIGLGDVIYSESLIENLSGGTYYFVAVDEEGCMLIIEVVINEPEPLTIEVTDANLGDGYITVSAIGGTQPYRYSIDDKNTSQDSITFTGLEPGDYTIIVIDDNGCESSVVYSLTGINDLDFEGLNIYPNPVSNFLHVEFEGSYIGVRIDLINRLGQVVKSYSEVELNSNSDVVDLQVKGIQSGSYVLRLKQDDKVGYRQVVIVQ